MVRTSMGRSRLLIFLAALALFGVTIGGISAEAVSENSRNEVVVLEAVPGLLPQFDNVRGRVQLVGYYDDNKNPAYPEPSYQAWMRLTQMPCLAHFLDPGDWTYAFWVQTPTNGLVRLFNFHSNCFDKTAAQDAIGFAAQAALETMFDETIQFRVTVENVVGDTGWPHGAVLLRGQRLRSGLVVECGNPPPESPVIDQVVLDAGETFRWTLEVTHEDFCWIRYAGTGPLVVDGYGDEEAPYVGTVHTFYCGVDHAMEAECLVSPPEGWVLRLGGTYEIEVQSLEDDNVISLRLAD